MEASAAQAARYINGEPVEEEPKETILDVASEQLDDLELQIAAREWTVAGTVMVEDYRGGAPRAVEFSKTYLQKPLSYTAMLQFTGLIGDRISSVMERGVTLESIVGEAGSVVGAIQRYREREDGSAPDLTAEDFSGVDALVNGLAKLASYVPSIIEECQCIWLRVPFNERPIVTEIWGRSPEDGGLSMQDGEDMLNLFIAQNYQELEDFFVERLPRLAKTVKKTRSLRGAGRRHWKPSNITAPHTLSQ
jgi:hypothetical protein